MYIVYIEIYNSYDREQISLKLYIKCPVEKNFLPEQEIPNPLIN